MDKVLQRLAQGQVAPVYLLYGEETYLIQESLSALTDRILGTVSRDFNYDVFQAESDTLAEALGIASTLPMMAAYRVVVLHGVQHLRPADWQRLEAYTAQPSESAVLLCSSAEGEATKCPARFVQQVMTIECKRLEGTALQAWVNTAVTRHGCTITAAALQELLREQQNDLWLLTQEVDKLCNYVGEAKSITPADVQAVCQTSRQLSVFALSDAIGARNMVSALTILDRLLNYGEPPLVIFSLMLRHLRLLWSIHQLTQQRRDLAHMAKTLALPLAVCRRLATQSRMFTAERLQHLYTAALEADLAFKTSPKPAPAILEELILELCAVSPGRPLTPGEPPAH